MNHNHVDEATPDTTDPHALPDMHTRPLSDETRQRMHAYYNSSTAYMEDLERHDNVYLENYITFVCANIPLHSTILDLGCGTGLSSRMLAERGFSTVGVDLSRLFLARGRTQDPAQPYVCGDLLQLPFANESVDVVCGTNFIEHVTDVPQCLQECWRVLRPGGYLLLAGPNLCSPFYPLQDLLSLVVRGRGRPVFAESSRAAWRWLWHNLRISTRKYLARQPEWIYREPDLSDRHVGGDADSTYLCCPIDFDRHFHTVADARVLRLSSGFSFKSRVIARLFPRWAPFLGLVVQKRRST